MDDKIFHGEFILLAAADEISHKKSFWMRYLVGNYLPRTSGYDIMQKLVYSASADEVSCKKSFALDQQI